MKYYHEFDANGNHRIGRTKYAPEKAGGESAIIWGKWASYQSPAMLGQVVGVTEYYKGSAEFPDPAQLYKVSPFKVTLIVV